MIELLVKYIQDKGFQVDVFPHVLHISKEANGLICGRNWAVLPWDLRPDLEECLFYDATRCCDEIDEEIRRALSHEDWRKNTFPGESLP